LGGEEVDVKRTFIWLVLLDFFLTARFLTVGTEVLVKRGERFSIGVIMDASDKDSDEDSDEEVLVKVTDGDCLGAVICWWIVTRMVICWWVYVLTSR
jgi:hypothetical protein